MGTPGHPGQRGTPGYPGQPGMQGPAGLKGNNDISFVNQNSRMWSFYLFSLLHFDLVTSEKPEKVTKIFQSVFSP